MAYARCFTHRVLYNVISSEDLSDEIQITPPDLIRFEFFNFTVRSITAFYYTCMNVYTYVTNIVIRLK